MDYFYLDDYWQTASDAEKWTMWNCLTSMLFTNMDTSFENFIKFHNGSHKVLDGTCRKL